MCGIAGFSLRTGSKVNSRALAHELLSAIEDRGSHASGFAFITDDDLGVYKTNKPGSQLPMFELPRRARNVVLHTRFATQGTPLVDANNHPVISPEGTIALVHNGVISNDWGFREEYGGEFEGLATVDSSVIPAVIERYGVDAVNKLEGYAAVAWLDERSLERQTLHLARLDFSPVAYTWLLDGSFVFASTEALLRRALDRLQLPYGGVFEMSEGEYFQIVNGIPVSRRDDLEMQEDSWVRYRYASATAGGHGGSEGGARTYIGSSVGNIQTFDDDAPTDDDDDMSWEDDYRARSCTTGSKDAAMALLPESNKSEDLQGYYITIEDGAIEALESLEQLESRLQWYSEMGLWDNPPFPNVEQKHRWVNFIIDVGHISVKDGMVSWLEDLAEIDQHESPAVYNLDYVRDGLAVIINGAAI